MFAGIDVYNAGATEATLHLRCPEVGEITTVVNPGAITRLRTGWRSYCSSITFTTSAAAQLQFDNVAYLP